MLVTADGLVAAAGLDAAEECSERNASYGAQAGHSTVEGELAEAGTHEVCGLFNGADWGQRSGQNVELRIGFPVEPAEQDPSPEYAQDLGLPRVRQGRQCDGPRVVVEDQHGQGVQVFAGATGHVAGNLIDVAVHVHGHGLHRLVGLTTQGAGGHTKRLVTESTVGGCRQNVGGDA